MAFQTRPFVAGFDAGFLLRRQIELIIGASVPLLIPTSGNFLFNVLTFNTSTGEARLAYQLMPDIFSVRQAYGRRGLDKIGFIGRNLNLADDLTKHEGNGVLLQAMLAGHVYHPVEYYVLRDNCSPKLLVLTHSTQRCVWASKELFSSSSGS